MPLLLLALVLVPILPLAVPVSLPVLLLSLPPLVLLLLALVPVAWLLVPVAWLLVPVSLFSVPLLSLPPLVLLPWVLLPVAWLLVPLLPQRKRRVKYHSCPAWGCFLPFQPQEFGDEMQIARAAHFRVALLLEPLSLPSQNQA